MAQSKLAILIETLYKGAGAQKAAKDMGALGKATQKSSMLQAVHKARTADLSKVMGQLANDVSKGTISVGQATKDFEAYKKALPVLEVEETTKKTMGMKDAMGKMALAVGAAGAAMVIAKKVFDLGAEGAQIQRTRDVFDRLSESIGETAGTILGKMRDATMGMVSDSELMRASARTMSMGLASTGDEAAKLAEVAVKLGAAMGKDAGPAMEEFGLLLANQSTLRLDTFGISAAKVKARIKELTDATPGLSRETAFMTATMEQAEISMEKLGDAVKADPFSVAQAEAANLTDELKILVSQIAGPVVGVIADAMRSNREYAESFNVLKKATNEAGNVLALTSDQTVHLRNYLQKLTIETLGTRKGSKALAFQQGVMATVMEHAVELAGMEETAMVDLAIEIYKNEQAVASLTKGYAAMTEAEGRGVKEAGFVLKSTQMIEGAYADMIGPARAVTGAYDDQTHAAENTAWAMGLYGDSLDEAAIAAENAAKEHDELTAAGLATRRAFGSGTLSALDAIVAAEEAGGEATSNLTDDLFRAASAAGADKFAMIELGLATGDYTRAQLEAAIETEVMTNRIEALGIMIAEGKVSTEQGLDALEAYGEGGVAEFERVINAAKDLNTALEDLPRDIMIKIRTEMATPGVGIPSDPNRPGGPKAQHGANFIVPPGYNGDKFPVWTSSGERVIVQTKEQQKAGGGGNNITINLGGGSGGGLVDAHRIAGAVADAIGARG